ncbi:MAG TPA: hypothetical protein VGA77_12070 [Propylenella sp.]
MHWSSFRWQPEKGIAATALRAVVIVAALLGLSGTASAFILQISATAFVPRDEAVPDTDIGEESNGLLLNADGRYFAPVVFPRAGRVCSFTLVARDNDGDFNVNARLMRKRFGGGAGAFDPPVVMARAHTSSASNDIQTDTDTTIAQAVINAANSFYYVELNLPFEALEVLGVQIDFRNSC